MALLSTAFTRCRYRPDGHASNRFARPARDVTCLPTNLPANAVRSAADGGVHPGVMHAFYSATEPTVVIVGTTHEYDPDDDIKCRWQDAGLDLDESVVGTIDSRARRLTASSRRCKTGGDGCQWLRFSWSAAVAGVAISCASSQPSDGPRSWSTFQWRPRCRGALCARDVSTLDTRERVVGVIIATPAADHFAIVGKWRRSTCRYRGEAARHPDR